MAARETQSFVIAGTFQQASATITQSFILVATFQQASATITQSFILVAAGLGITCNNPPNGQTGSAYSHGFPAGSGDPPYTWSLSAGVLPQGLTLDASTGVVSGVPTAAGLFLFTVTVTDSLTATDSVDCSIAIGGSRGFKKEGAGSPKFCPEIRRNVDWRVFQETFEDLRPANVEEVRVPECPVFVRRW